MLRRSAVLAGLFVLLAGGAQAESVDIVGGQPVTPGQFPFLVQVAAPVGNGRFIMCTGSLIAPTWVLTAAHCGNDVPPQYVSIGDASPDNPYGVTVSELQVASWIPHPQYNRQTFENDIALIKLSADARNYPPTYQGQPLYSPQAVGLAASPASTSSGIGNVTIAGFGLTAPADPASAPSASYWAGPIPTLPISTCGGAYGVTLSPLQKLCFGAMDQFTCQGDSGGAVFAGQPGAYLAYGVVSFGSNPCGLAPAVATYVPGYRAWIEQQINGASPGGTCSPSSTRLCLLNNRFSVRLRWNDGSGFRDALVAEPKANSSGSGAGLFYFYAEDPSNWEVLVKMIDACGSSNFWLLGSASTGFGWELTVRDERSGLSKTYTKPLNGQASGIADFSAFQTCGQ